jgi:glutathione S-transferase
MSFELYGSFRSRTRRPQWAALEVGADFSHIPLSAQDPGLKDEAFRKINPLGRIPAFKDGDLTFSESLAINLHIAKTYGAHLEPAIYPAEAEAKILQWSFFAASDLDPWVVLYRVHALLLPEEQREPKLAKYGSQSIDQALAHLEVALASASFLAAPHFTIADLNVASVLQPLIFIDYPLDAYPAVQNWLTQSLARPAARAALEYP